MAEEDLKFEDIEEPGSDIDGDALLNEVRAFLERFVSYPSRHASVAHALWIAHTHLMDIWDSTPRIAFMAPERASGKSRALEVMEFLVPRPVFSVNNSVAYTIREIADESGRPTILQDEVDALFGNKDPAKADLLSLYNAGHRKGATSGRCVTGTGPVKKERLPAYGALALAGLRDLPDTLGSRAILIEMRRRAPDEPIVPWRHRLHKPQAGALFCQIADWCCFVSKRIEGKYPELPAEITDRDADCWEPLVAIADAAGGDWSTLAREAAVFLVRRGKEKTLTKGVELLQHIREAFGEEEKLWTEDLLKRLHDRNESPWADIRGKPLTDRGLADRLKQYGIKSTQVKISSINRQGYNTGQFYDAWNRYLDPVTHGNPYQPYQPYFFDNKSNLVGEVGEVGDGVGESVCEACDGNLGKGCPTCKPREWGVGQ